MLGLGLLGTENSIRHLFTKEDWHCRPTLDNLEFLKICAADVDQLEKDSKEEVKQVVFTFGRDKAPGPDGFFQIFWEVIKVDVMTFMKEFHDRGKLSKHFCASFIILIAKENWCGEH